MGIDLHDSQSSEVSQDMLRIKPGRKKKEDGKLEKDAAEMLITGAVPSLGDAHRTDSPIWAISCEGASLRKVNSQTGS